MNSPVSSDWDGSKPGRIGTALKERANAPQGLTLNRMRLDWRAAMQSTDPSPAEFLEARTARNVSIKTAAREIGVAFATLVRWNRGGGLLPRTAMKVQEWIDATPEPEMTTETWRPVVGWEGYYEVSDLGTVRGVERKVPHAYSGTITIRSRIIKHHPHPAGHRLVCLNRGGVGGGVTRQVHQLVLEAFVGPRADGMDACHNDGDPANNRLSNLRWDTHSENMLDRVWHEANPGVVRPEVLARSADGGAS